MMAEEKVLTLEEYYKDDPGLLAFYKKKLLIRGWQPHMNAMEREYVRRMNPPWYKAGVLKTENMRTIRAGEERLIISPKSRTRRAKPLRQEG